jgi:hypothetical protein
MRPLLLTLPFFLFFPACGGGDASCPGGSQNGTWIGVSTSDQFIFTSACGVTYTSSSGCQSTGGYDQAMQNNGTAKLTISKASGSSSDCLTTGVHSCSYDFLSDTLMTLDCGLGTLKYQKNN